MAYLFRRSSVATTTLGDIGRYTETSKSQLFHYFPDGKEQLLCVVAEFEADRVVDDSLQASRLASWPAWYEGCDAVLDSCQEADTSCPFAAQMMYVGCDSPGARSLLRVLLDRWWCEFTQGIRAMQAELLLPASSDVERCRSGNPCQPARRRAVLATADRFHLEAALDQSIEQLRLYARLGPEPALPAREPFR